MSLRVGRSVRLGLPYHFPITKKKRISYIQIALKCRVVVKPEFCIFFMYPLELMISEQIYSDAVYVRV